MGDRRNAYQKISEYKNKNIKTDRFGYIVRLILSTRASGIANNKLITKTTENNEFKIERVIKTNSYRTVDDLAGMVYDHVETLGLKYKHPISREEFIDECTSYYYLYSEESLKKLMTSTDLYKDKVKNAVARLVEAYGSGTDKSALKAEVERLVNRYYITGTSNTPITFDPFKYTNAKIIAHSVSKYVAPAAYSLNATKVTQGMVNESVVRLSDDKIPDFVITGRQLEKLVTFHNAFKFGVCDLAKIVVLASLAKKYKFDDSNLSPDSSNRGRVDAFKVGFLDYRKACADRNSVQRTHVIERLKKRFNSSSTLKIIGASQSRANKTIITMESFVEAMNTVNNLYDYILATGIVPEFTRKDLESLPNTGSDINLTSLSESKRIRQLLLESIDSNETTRFSDLVGDRFVNGIDRVINPIVNNIGDMSISKRVNRVSREIPVAPVFINTGIVSGLVSRKISINQERKLIADVYSCSYIERKSEYSHKIHQEDKKTYQVFPTPIDRLTTDLEYMDYNVLSALMARSPHNDMITSKFTITPSLLDYSGAFTIKDKYIQAKPITENLNLSVFNRDSMNDCLFTELEATGFNLEATTKNIQNKPNMYLKEPFLCQKRALNVLRDTVKQMSGVRDSHLQVLKDDYSYFVDNNNSISTGSSTMSLEQLYDSVPSRYKGLLNSLIFDKMRIKSLTSKQVTLLDLPCEYDLYSKYLQERGKVSKDYNFMIKALPYYTSMLNWMGSAIKSSAVANKDIWNKVVSSIKFATIDTKEDASSEDVKGLYNKLSSYVSGLIKGLEDYRYIPLIYRDFVFDSRMDAYLEGDLSRLAKTCVYNISGNPEILAEMIAGENQDAKDILYSKDRLLSIDGKSIFIEMGKYILDKYRGSVDMLATIHTVFGSTGDTVTSLTPNNVEHRLHLLYDFADKFSDITELPNKISGLTEAMDLFKLTKRGKPSLITKEDSKHSFAKQVLIDLFDNSAIIVFDIILRKESYIILHNGDTYKVQRGGLFKVNFDNNTEHIVQMETIKDTELVSKIKMALSGIASTSEVFRSPVTVLNEAYTDFIKMNATEDDKYILDGNECKVKDLLNMFDLMGDITEYLNYFEENSLSGIDRLRDTLSCISLLQRYLRYMYDTREVNITPDNIVSKVYSIIVSMIQPVIGAVKDGKDLSDEYKVFGDYKRVSYVKDNAMKFNTTIMDTPNKPGIKEIQSYFKSHNDAKMGANKPVYLCPVTKVYVFDTLDEEPFLVKYRNKIYGISGYGYLIPDTEICPDSILQQGLTEKIAELRVANPIIPIEDSSIHKLRGDYTGGY